MPRYFLICLMLLSLFPVSSAIGAEDPDELYRQGRFEEAEKAYAGLDMDHPKDIRYRYNKGCAAFQSSDLEGASAAFKSVLRRSEDKETRFKASYNLANTAFKQGDLQSALENYKQAIQMSPENEDARYNLELTLREIERQEKQQKENKQDQSQEDQKDKGEKEDQSDKKEGKEGDQKENSGEQQEKDESGKEGESKGQQDAEAKNNKQGESQEQDTRQQEQQDFSGELSGPQDMPEQQAQEQGQPEMGLDQKKAEALLDNLNEDRSKMLRFQIPKDKRYGVPSGKDW